MFDVLLVPIIAKRIFCIKSIESNNLFIGHHFIHSFFFFWSVPCRTIILLLIFLFLLLLLNSFCCSVSSSFYYISLPLPNFLIFYFDCSSLFCFTILSSTFTEYLHLLLLNRIIDRKSENDKRRRNESF